MRRQKVIITLSDGTVAVFEGPPQVDTSRPIKVIKFQFTVPKEDRPKTGNEPFDGFFESIFGKGFGK
jgi:hypothetical protein